MMPETKAEGSLHWAPCHSAASGERLPGGRVVLGGGERSTGSGRAGGKRELQEARTHLHTPRSGRTRAAGVPARTATDSCCSSSLGRRQGGGEVGLHRPRKTLAVARVGWWVRSSRGSRAAPQAGRPLTLASALSCSLSLLGVGSAAKLASGAPGRQRALSKVAGCSATAPAARGPDCQ